MSFSSNNFNILFQLIIELGFIFHLILAFIGCIISYLEILDFLTFEFASFGIKARLYIHVISFHINF